MLSSGGGFGLPAALYPGFEYLMLHLERAFNVVIFKSFNNLFLSFKTLVYFIFLSFFKFLVKILRAHAVESVRRAIRFLIFFTKNVVHTF